MHCLWIKIVDFVYSNFLTIRTHDPYATDPGTLPSSVRVERCPSHPIRTNRSAAKCKRLKSRATCNRHVSHGTGHAATDLAYFLAFNCVKGHLPGSVSTRRCGAKAEFMKSLFTCLSHLSKWRHRRHSQKQVPTHGG